MIENAYMTPVGRNPKEPTTIQGKWVRHVRTDVAHMTQEEFADAIKCERPSVSNWERGRYIPEWASIEKIVRKFPAAPRPPFGPPGAETPPAATPAPIPNHARTTFTSLAEAIEVWCIAAGDPALIDDPEFMRGLLDLYMAYRQRRAAGRNHAK